MTQDALGRGMRELIQVGLKSRVVASRNAAGLAPEVAR